MKQCSPSVLKSQHPLGKYRAINAIVCHNFNNFAEIISSNSGKFQFEQYEAMTGTSQIWLVKNEAPLS